MTPHNADQSNLAAQPRRDDFTTEKFVSSRIMRAEGATMKRKSDVADKIKRCVRARELGKKHYTPSFEWTLDLRFCSGLTVGGR
jgi:hypothetical protein